MISLESMYASSAFSSGQVGNEFLAKMDQAEKNLIEQEEREISKADEKEQKKARILIVLFLGTMSTYLSGAYASDCGYTGWNWVKNTFPFPLVVAIGGYVVGGSVVKNIDIRRKINFERLNRLQEKINNIFHQEKKESLDAKEIGELQQAHAFFNKQFQAQKK